MRVYTYYEPLEGHPNAQPLIDLWRATWTEHGWEPTVLNREDAKRHPGYDHFANEIRRLPTCNTRAYEEACYFRHLAMAEVGGGLLTDYDVICRHFTPQWFKRITDGSLLILEPTRVPCAIAGNHDAFEDVCDIIAEYQLKPEDQARGKPHISDMEILRKTDIQVTDECVEHLCSGETIRDDPGEGWRTAPMIHFSTFSFQKLGLRGHKHELISQVLDQLDANVTRGHQYQVTAQT